MLRKNPGLRPSAADLLRQPHLQPYVLEIHLKSSNPRRNALMAQHSESIDMKEGGQETSDVPLWIDNDNRASVRSNRILNPSVSGAEDDSLCYDQVQELSTRLNQNLEERSVDSTHAQIMVSKPIAVKSKTVFNTARVTTTSTTPSKQKKMGKMVHAGSDSIPLPGSRTPASKSVRPVRKASLPMSARAATLESPSRATVSLLQHISSPDVSINIPQIDRVAEFPLTSSEDLLHPISRASSSPTKCSSTSPQCRDRSITKDKCIVQNRKKAVSRPKFSKARKGIRHGTFSMNGEDGSECSNKNPTAGRGTSGYRQRAEALEGLLEFSANLLLQERFDELEVLLKPFGPEKVSPRETAIWLTKSFKETAAKYE